MAGQMTGRPAGLVWSILRMALTETRRPDELPWRVWRTARMQAGWPETLWRKAWTGLGTRSRTGSQIGLGTMSRTSLGSRAGLGANLDCQEWEQDYELGPEL